MSETPTKNKKSNKKKLPVSALALLPQMIGILNSGEIDLDFSEQEKRIIIEFSDDRAFEKLKEFIKSYE